MNYKKVIEDYNNGTIDPNEWVLIMDNDGGYWTSPTMDEETRGWEVKRKHMYTTYGQPDGYRDIINVLRAAGVECEWC